MTVLNKAALIEQAAKITFMRPGIPLGHWERMNEDSREAFSEDTARALPVIAKALLAPLRELHKPVNLIFSWHSGVRSEDPCETCGGKAGVHPCGCWGGYDLPVYCEACSAASEFKRSVAHPCPTVQLLDAIEADLQ